MLMVGLVTVPTLPARSVALPLADWPAASADRVTGPSVPATPDRLSVAAKLTTTLSLYQLLAFGGGSRRERANSAVVAVSLKKTVTGPALPARSVARPLAEWRAVP